MMSLMILICDQQGFAQEKQSIKWLFSTELDVKNGFSGSPQTQSFCSEVALGVRLKHPFQIEIPVGVETKWEMKGEKVLAKSLTAGFALGYHWDSARISPVSLKVLARSVLTKADFSGAEVGAIVQFFLDDSEQAFLSLGGGHLFGFASGVSSYYVQAGIGIRLVRSNKARD